MLDLTVFLNMTTEEKHERLLTAFDSMENAYDRYRAICTVEALAYSVNEADSVPDNQEIDTATGARLCRMLYRSIDELTDRNLRRLLCHLFDLLDEQECEAIQS